jgi:hypothetical protein
MGKRPSEPPPDPMTERSEGIENTVRTVASSDEGGPMTERSEGAGKHGRPGLFPTKEAP